MKRWIAPVVIAALALAGCGGDDDEDASAEDWESAALVGLDNLVEALETAGFPCADYLPYDHSVMADDYDGRDLPLPAAMGSCTIRNDEGLELVAYADADAKQEFMDAKQTLLCANAEEQGLDVFPGFPYVDGGTWTIQPDSPATADELAAALDAESVMAGCD